jgi:hypothetical protein
MEENKQNRSRRDFLKRLGWGGASAVGMMAIAPLSTFGKAEDESADPSKMAIRENRRTGDKVSLLGYGMMRLPSKDRAINQDMVNQEVDYALAHGVNYFDTAPVYHGGRSEEAVGKALSRHPRDKYFVATKLSNFGRDQWNLESAKNMLKQSMEKLKVDYIDYYLLHSVGGKGPDEFKARFEDNGIVDFLQQERKAGRIRNLGFSFHGSVETFDYLIDNNDDFEWDFVQIQMNYIDWRHADSRRGNTDAEYLYNKLEKAGIQCVIMEPLLGGRLARVPEDVQSLMKEVRPSDSPARWAFRWVGSYPNVLTVLSGMTTMEVLQENVATFSPLEPSTDSENALMTKIADKMNGVPVIPCTDCKYCMPCAFGLDIPENFSVYNKAVNDGVLPLPDKTSPDYQKCLDAVNKMFQKGLNKEQWATKCTDCEACLPKCPQHIRIPNQMGRIAEILRKR